MRAAHYALIRRLLAGVLDHACGIRRSRMAANATGEAPRQQVSHLRVRGRFGGSYRVEMSAVHPFHVLLMKLLLIDPH